MAVRQQRKELIKAAENGDPLDYLTVGAIVGDIKRVGQRLEDNAEAASLAGQRQAVAALSGQQLRATEVRAKLGAIGGYAPPKSTQAEATMFNLTINLPGGVTKQLSGTPDQTIPGPSRHVPMLDVTPVALTPAALDAGDPAGDAEDLDKILDCVFNHKPEPVEVEPAPAPRRGRPRRA